MDAKAKIRIEGENATQQAFNEVVRGAQEASERIRGYFEAAFVGISFAGLGEMVAYSLELGESLDKASIKAGISGKAMSELAYAAKLSNVDVESLSNGLKKMEVALSKAATGGHDQKLALDALGLSIANLQGLSPDKQFELLGQRISELTDPADRARAAVTLFGKAGTDMLPIFAEGGEGIRKLREEAQKFGQSFDDDTLKRLTEANESIKKLEGSFSALWTTLVSKASPGLSTFADDLNRAINSDKISQLEKTREGLKDLKDRLAATVNPDDTARLEKVIRSQQAKLDMLEAVAAEPGIQKLSFEPKALEPTGFASGFAAADAADKAQAEYEKTAKEIQRLSNEIEKTEFENISKISDANVKEDTKHIDLVNKRFFDEKKAEDDILRMRKDAERTWRQDIQVGTDALKQSYDDFVAHGQFSFAKFGQFIIAELSRKEIYKAIDKLGDELDHALDRAGSGGGIFGAILGAFGFGGGAGALSGKSSGVGELTGSTVGFAANGADAAAGEPFIIGEKGPELFIPRTAGTIVPNGATGASGRGGGGGTVINYAPVTNIGNGVTRVELLAAMKQTHKGAIGEMTQLIKGGAFA